MMYWIRYHMKKVVLISLALILLGGLDCFSRTDFSRYDYSLEFYLPGTFSNQYDSSVPKPDEILGHGLGEFFPEWYAVLNYMYTLDKVSDRICLKEIGRTHEKRPIVQLIITSPSNHARLDEIRAGHLSLCDVSVPAPSDVSEMPLVFANVNSIHGNEQSGVCSSMAIAYFFAASQDERVLNLLENTVLILVPGMNPDGINRYASFCNSVSSIDNRQYDNNAIDFRKNEPWPLSRVNHFWCDLNRDLAMLQHPESRSYVDMLCDWMPDILYDNHEQSKDRGLFFSPGDRNRVHPCIPSESQDLAAFMGKYTASTLDSLGVAYFTGSSFDDFYLGKGAAYGDVQGTISILVEHVNTDGFTRIIKDGKVLTFPDAIRNMTHVGINSIFAAYENRTLLHNFKRDFFVNSAKRSAADEYKATVFNTRGDRVLEYLVLDWMRNHRFDVYELAKDVEVDGIRYRKEDSYIVPYDQKYYLKFKGLWDDLTDYHSDHFYDITTWSANRAFNVNESKLEKVKGLLGDKVENVNFPEGNVDGKSWYGYLISPDNIYYHKALAVLLKQNVKVKIATSPVVVSNRTYRPGTASISVDMQPLCPQEVDEQCYRIARECGLDIEPMKEDLWYIGDKYLEKMPKVALLTGDGFSFSEAGEIWYMLERHLGISVSRIDANRLTLVKDLNQYDVMIAAGGTPKVDLIPEAYEIVRRFVENGGRLIATGHAVKFLQQTQLADFKLKSIPENGASDPIKGVIINTYVDDNDPIGYGCVNNIPVFKKDCIFLDENVGEYDSFPVRATENPYLSGCVSEANLAMISSAPVIVTKKVGNGSVVYSTDNLTFRSYWYGTMKLLLNAILFAELDKPVQEID